VRAGLEKLESALQQIKHHRRAGPLQITTYSSFLQIWLLPRIRSFRRKFPNVELRFHTSREVVDFSRTAHHVGIRFGPGNYPNLHSEKILDEWLVPVANPDLIKQYGMIERGADLSKYPLLESDDEPWSFWSQTDRQAAWVSGAPSIDDSAGLLAAAEEGLGYALASWTLVTRALHKGTLRLAGRGALPYNGSAYYFVCPKNFLAIPKVAQFREWILATAREFPGPSAPDAR
jgi:LysR family glycine cleavage system transcriptional activator